MSFHDSAVNELTRLDREMSAKPRAQWNPYFLGIALTSLQDVEKEMLGAVPEEIFREAFTPSREMHRVARRLGLALDVDRGQWIAL